MKINEYIQHRHNLEQLDIGVLNNSDYEKENSDYKKLLKVSNNNYSELPLSLGDKYILWFYIFIGFILSIIFSMGYSDEIHKVINIAKYVLFVITIPLIIFIGSFIYNIYSRFSKKTKFDWFERIFDDLFKIKFIAKQEEYLKEVFKIASLFYFNIVSISYSISSIIWLLYFTGINAYTFSWDSTWVSTQIIKGYSTIIESINFNLIPIELKQEAVRGIDSQDNTWLWFLIVLTIVWIIIPKIVLLVLNKYKVEKKLDDSFINNSKSQRILDYISPKTSTTNNSVIKNENVVKSQIITQKIVFDLSQNHESNFETFLLWQLDSSTIQIIEQNYRSINKIVLGSVSDLNKFNIDNSISILILVNIDNSPKKNFINLLNRLTNHNITIKFVDINGIIINSNSNIDEWLRFVGNENIKIEVNK